jgi:H+/Cl- antiporter ClcA
MTETIKRHPVTETPPIEKEARAEMKERGDFSAEVRLVWISGLAVLIGAVCALIAVLLQGLIAIFTNLFYFQEFSLALGNSPAGNNLGWMAILVPVVGGLIIGVMARYGSERIRGHGIPEAIEAILIGQSRMQIKVAVLKPLSSAISIGSGGPFGAEGPIIMTGGAFGSIMAQIFHLSAAERKTLLVAGAAGGMTAIFATPVAAVLLAVELLLFELKPRSLIPVALACVMAMAVRPLVMEEGPLFALLHTGPMPATALLSAGLLGLLCGLLALLLTLAVYAMEDLFQRLPIHWMWWPAVGGLIVGIGGYLQPRALGVGYDIIGDLLNTEEFHFTMWSLLALMVVKSGIWSVALGSGTSGGVLAPLLIMGGALGALASSLLPGGDRTLWALVGMAAAMGGTMRSPLTATVFALEITHDINALPALLIGCVVAHAFTVLVMPRSILTEKVARRGYHVSREYAVDPLELVSIGDVMSTEVVTIPAALPVHEVLKSYFQSEGSKKHQGYPVVDPSGAVVGVLTRSNLLEHWISADFQRAGQETPIIAYDLLHRPSITALPWESCRAAAERMAETHVGRLVIVSPDDPDKIVGIATRSDILKSRARTVEEEHKRERFLGTSLVPTHKQRRAELRGNRQLPQGATDVSDGQVDAPERPSEHSSTSAT